MSVSARIVGILGWPLGHSLSPRLHNRAFESRGLAFRYDVFPVPPARLAEMVKTLREREELAGFNVTIPHKETIIPLLDEVDAEAKAVGAVNCVRAAKGRLRGTNTDASGFAESLAVEGSFETRGSDAVVLGAGGASRAVVHALGGSGASSVTVLARRPDRAAALVRGLAAPASGRSAGDGGSGTTFRADALDPATVRAVLAAARLLVNATPVGMLGGEAPDALPLPEAEALHENLLVCDLVYAPRETPLLRAARQRGARTLDGLPMLARQAAAAFRMWTGQAMSGEEMLALAEAALKDRR